MSNASSEKNGRVLKIVLWVCVGLLVLAVVGVGVAVYFTSQPGFFARYARLQRNYAALQTSVHKGMTCGQCHAPNGGSIGYRVALVGDFYRSLVNTPRIPAFVKFGPPSRAACLQCHAYDWSDDAKRTMKVPHPAHLRVITETRDCVKCHKWTAHEEAYQAKHTTMPFSRVCASFECHSGTKPIQDCKNCHHVLQESLGAWKDIHPQTVRAFGPNGCIERCHTADQCRQCHTTGKTPVFSGTIAESSTIVAIERQHVRRDWIARHGTFALQDQSKCLQCHVSEGECQDCHSKRPAFHGSPDTWKLQHQAIAKANPKRCLTCHEQAWCDACHKQFKEMR